MRKNISKSYDYIEKLVGVETAQMQRARQNSEKLGLDTISISATEAYLIRFHLRGISPRKVVEIGTLTGLSALHILEEMPADGKLYTLEKSEEHANLAREVLTDSRCEIRLGDARESLQSLTAKGPFDAVFIDGNKAAYLDYYDWALENTRKEGLIFVDNIFLAGAVWGDTTKQRFNPKQVGVVHQMNEKAFQDSSVNSVIIPTEEGLLISKKRN